MRHVTISLYAIQCTLTHKHCVGVFEFYSSIYTYTYYIYILCRGGKGLVLPWFISNIKYNLLRKLEERPVTNCKSFVSILRYIICMVPRCSWINFVEFCIFFYFFFLYSTIFMVIFNWWIKFMILIISIEHLMLTHRKFW